MLCEFLLYPEASKKAKNSSYLSIQKEVIFFLCLIQGELKFPRISVEVFAAYNYISDDNLALQTHSLNSNPAFSYTG